jgi:hypothetical protein
MIRSLRWRPARTVPSGLELSAAAWRGSTRMGAGRPTARPAPTAACRTDDVQALAPGADGALWVGTDGGGLTRLDKDGRWQT